MKQKPRIMATILAAGVAFSTPVIADHQLYNLKVETIFAEGTSTAGFFPVTDISNICLFGILYLDLSTDAGKAWYTLVIATKSKGWILQRVDYLVKSSGKCSVTAVHAGTPGRIN